MDSYPLKYIKSKYILKQIVDHITKNNIFKLIKYNKLFQEKLNIGIIDYKNYYEKIEIILKTFDEEIKNNFINIKEEYKSYCHIYFNDDKDEKRQYYFNKGDNITKIKIILDNEIKSFEELFSCCRCIEKIEFINFNRNDIHNMQSMFYGCSSLKELNLNKFNTINVTDMRGMFHGCSSLKKLNLNNFNTTNVTDMGYMIFKCSSLKELNLNNFNTINVTNMCYMFYKCYSLKKLYINNFNTIKVDNMAEMFYECSSLKELNFDNFNIDNVIHYQKMFCFISEELKMKIINKFKNINNEVFEYY